VKDLYELIALRLGEEHPMVTLLVISSTQSALQGLVEDPPTDPASIFALLLSFGLIGAVLWAGKGPKDPPTPE